jgi:hypothetical protein
LFKDARATKLCRFEFLRGDRVQNENGERVKLPALLSLLSLFLALGSARANPTVKFSAPGWSAQVGWLWLDSEEKVGQLFARARVSAPGGKKIAAIDPERGLWNPSTAQDFFFTGKKDRWKVKFSDGSTQDVEAELQFPSFLLIQKGCKEAQIALKPVAATGPASFLGIECRFEGEDLLLSVSAPDDAEWGATSIVESAGRGERSRQFTFPKMTRALQAREIGKIALTIQGKDHVFSVQQLKSETLLKESKAQEQKMKELEKQVAELRKQQAQKRQQQQKESKVTFQFGVGAGNLKLVSSNTNASSIQAMLFLFARTLPLFGNFRIGGQLKYATALKVSGVESLGFTEFALHTSHPLRLSRSVSFDPQLWYLNVSQDYSPTGFALTHSQFGFGAALRFAADSGAALRLFAVLSGVVPAADSQHSTFGLQYNLAPGESITWNLHLFYQKGTLSNIVLVPVTFDQALLAVALQF